MQDGNYHRIFVCSKESANKGAPEVGNDCLFLFIYWFFFFLVFSQPLVYVNVYICADVVFVGSCYFPPSAQCHLSLPLYLTACWRHLPERRDPVRVANVWSGPRGYEQVEPFVGCSCLSPKPLLSSSFLWLCFVLSCFFFSFLFFFFLNIYIYIYIYRGFAILTFLSFVPSLITYFPFYSCTCMDSVYWWDCTHSVCHSQLRCWLAFLCFPFVFFFSVSDASRLVVFFVRMCDRVAFSPVL